VLRNGRMSRYRSRPGLTGATVLGVLLAAAGGTATWLTRSPPPPRPAVQAEDDSAALRVFGRPKLPHPGPTARILVEIAGRREHPADDVFLLITRPLDGSRPFEKRERLESRVVRVARGTVFESAPLPSGMYHLIGTAGGSLGGRLPVEVAGRDVAVRLELAPLAPATSATGLVYAKTGQVVPHAEVLVKSGGGGQISAVSLTDSRGRFEVPVSASPSQIQVRAEGYLVESKVVRLPSVDSLRFELDLQPVLRGRVLTTASHAGVGMALVRAEALGRREGATYETHSDREGRFSLALVPGRYRLSAGGPGLAGFQDTILTVARAAVEDATIHLERAFAISGTVRDASGQGVPQAEVLIDVPRTDAQARMGQVVAVTGEDGRFTVEGALPGNYRLSAQAPPRYGTAEPRELRLAPGQNVTDIALTLPPAALVRGRVLGPGGEPVAVAYVAVEVKGEDGGAGSPVRGFGQVAVGRNGDFEVGGLGPGHLRVTARSPKLGRVEHRDELAAGETKDVHLRFKSVLAYVSGQVRWKTGAPAPRVPVRWVASERSGDRLVTVTDLEGRYRLGPLGPGKGRVELRRPSADARAPVVIVAELEIRDGKSESKVDGVLE
jgi:hypothetical protein